MENTQVVFEKDDYRYMKQAITQAKKAYKLNEVPIGCVIVYEGKVIGRGYNRRNTDKTSLAKSCYRFHESQSRMCRFNT